MKTREVSYDYMKHISECIFNEDLVVSVTRDNEVYHITDIEGNKFSLTSWGVMIAEMNNGQNYKCYNSKIHEIYRDFGGFIKKHKKSVEQYGYFKFKYEF